MWLFSEYADDSNLEDTMDAVLDALRPLPLLVQTKEEEEAAAEVERKKSKASPEPIKTTTRTVVLADGTYGTEDVVDAPADHAALNEDEKKSQFKKLLSLGDYLLATTVGVSLTRMALRLEQRRGASVALRNEVIFLLANLCRLLRTAHLPKSNEAVEPHRTRQSAREQLTEQLLKPSTNDSLLRLQLCIKVLTTQPGVNEELELVKKKWLSEQGKLDLARVLELEAQNAEWRSSGGYAQDATEKTQIVPPSEAICFRQLRRDGRDRVNSTSLDFDDEGDFNIARGADKADGDDKAGNLFGERLANVQQMTGLADPIYVEAFLQVHSFDLLLEVLLVNRTDETLQNCTVELCTQGDLKIVDRPQAVVLAPGQQQVVHASIKVSSTETGVIFGYVSFEKKSATDKESIVLSELHVDILDYIEKGNISELKFRTQWSEFEWENKINV